MKEMKETQHDPIRVILSDEVLLGVVAVTSMLLCFLLIILPALKMSSSGGKFITDHAGGLSFISFVLVTFFLLFIFGMIASHPVNNNIFTMLYVLLLLTAISVIEMSIVSLVGAMFTLFIWMAAIAKIVYLNWKKIHNVDIVVLKRIQKFVAPICIISVIWNVNRIFHAFNP
ncbi:uncharacterized protein LOC127096155 [Lathyrus oleraceus]|uniref:Yip1 domain-containing protein n=1 Tax=Pisum sativum TaxID=3888 RepID=A0A9D5BGH1_PEA|nr:uncharacterized protein LOC127096155 [Pisum sativum]KAI5443136.1 hypothetical protein KIW84_011973 [Pisum sativum]